MARRALREDDIDLKSLLDRASADCDGVVVRRSNGDEIAVLPAQELRSLRETLHLFSSPANGKRLLDSLASVRRGEGVRMTLAELRADVGLDD
jgi:antitoxin YefM